MRYLLLLLAFPLYGYDFSMQLLGPVTATPGYPLYLQIDTKIIEGVRPGYQSYTLTSPFPAALTGPNSHPSWGMKTYDIKPVLLRVDVPADAAQGDHLLTLKGESGGVTHEDSITLTVAVPKTYAPIATRPAAPASLDKWRERFLQYGKSTCNQATITSGGMWEGNVWFYDGTRVYYQAGDYFNDRTWDACAGYVRDVYLPAVIAAAGKIQGWRVFPEGLYQTYLRTGNEEAKTAVVLLAKQSAYAGYGGGLSPFASRETAFVLDAQRFARKLGQTQPLEPQTLAFALGHLDQWSNPKAKFAGDKYVQPFMVGLTMEALIEYYLETPDPRIPPAVERALESLWQYWVPAGAGFDYITNDATVTASPDLNLLIAPAYAWAHKMTGNPVYRERGEQVFTGGVNGAWLGAGKQFSQNYRWSFRYVEWLSDVVTTPDPEPEPEPTPEYVTRAELQAAIKELRDSALTKAELAAAIEALKGETLTKEQLKAIIQQLLSGL